MEETIFNCEGIEINYGIKCILKQEFEICEKCSSYRLNHRKEWTQLGTDDEDLINTILDRVEAKISFATRKQLRAYVKRQLGHNLNGVDRTHLSRLNNKILQIEKHHSLLSYFKVVPSDQTEMSKYELSVIVKTIDYDTKIELELYRILTRYKFDVIVKRNDKKHLSKYFFNIEAESEDLVVKTLTDFKATNPEFDIVFKILSKDSIAQIIAKAKASNPDLPFKTVNNK